MHNVFYLNVYLRILIYLKKEAAGFRKISIQKTLSNRRENKTRQ